MRPIKRAIILCWIMLVACFAIKLFGGNWFEVVCTNEHFSNFCDFVERTRVVYETISFVIYVIPTIFIVLSFSLIPSPNKKQIIIILSSLVFLWLTTFISVSLKGFLELLFFIALPVILNHIGSNNKIKETIKKTWYYGIIGCVVSLLFQFVSLITKNIGIKIISDDVLVTFIMLIDYYIMLALYYLYVKLRKEQNNG